MNPHDKLRALVGEFSEEYVLCAKINGKILFASSNFQFASDVLEELQETISEWRKSEEAKNRKHHHSDRSPKQEKSDSSQQGE